MSVDIIPALYRVDSYDDAHAALEPCGLTRGDALCSRWHTTVVWVGAIMDPPPTYDAEGNETEPGVDRGLHINVYRRADGPDDGLIAALDADARFERVYPVTPTSVLA